MSEVVTLGETMAVICPDQPHPLAEATRLTLDIAGAESNLAILLSRFGPRVSFISRVGNDAFGQRIRATLAVENLDLSHLMIDEDAPTGIFFREWLPDGKRRVLYYRAGSAASRLSPEDLQPEMFQGARILHVTGITPALSSRCAAAVEYAIELAHAAGARVSFDPNYRPALWKPEVAREVLLPLMQQADILLIGHEDGQAILGLDDTEQILQAGIDLGARIVVLKQAEQGACVWDGHTCVSASAEYMGDPIDPVGAGDAFGAGFLAGLLRGDTLEDALRLGIRAGAATVTIRGDYISQERFDQIFRI